MIRVACWSLAQFRVLRRKGAVTWSRTLCDLTSVRDSTGN